LTPTLDLDSKPQEHARAAVLTLALLSLGHFFIDLYAAALGALQPLLVQKFHLSLAQAGVLGGMLSFSSSVTQPLYGYLSDRFHTRMFSALAPAVAGIFISAMGIAPGYGWLLLMAVLGGAGVASFHPQATANAAARMVHNRQKALAVFISSGTLGLAFGPAYFSFLTSRWGLDNSYWGAAAGILVTILLLAFLPLHEPPQVTPGRLFDWAPLHAVWKPLTILYFLVFIRSIIQVSYGHFLALYLHLERGYTVPAAGVVLSLFLGFGALGGFIGGHLADRFGGRRVILASMIGSVPFFLLFMLARGWASLAGLILGGAILLFTIPVNVVMAQELAPSQAGTVSALMMGFSWGMAGILFIPLTGRLADAFTLHNTLLAWVAFPVLGFFLTLLLPRDRR
jgi:FSR family fosmidomycin resistance protein-like MFS transporter